jgi:hypothetical protein
VFPVNRRWDEPLFTTRERFRGEMRRPRERFSCFEPGVG